jgi:hypothetical protein
MIDKVTDVRERDGPAIINHIQNYCFTPKMVVFAPHFGSETVVLTGFSIKPDKRAPIF